MNFSTFLYAFCFLAFLSATAFPGFFYACESEIPEEEDNLDDYNSNVRTFNLEATKYLKYLTENGINISDNDFVQKVGPFVYASDMTYIAKDFTEYLRFNYALAKMVPPDDKISKFLELYFELRYHISKMPFRRWDLLKLLESVPKNSKQFFLKNVPTLGRHFYSWKYSHENEKEANKRSYDQTKKLFSQYKSFIRAIECLYENYYNTFFNEFLARKKILEIFTPKMNLSNFLSNDFDETYKNIRIVLLEVVYNKIDATEEMNIVKLKGSIKLNSGISISEKEINEMYQTASDYVETILSDLKAEDYTAKPRDLSIAKTIPIKTLLPRPETPFNYLLALVPLAIIGIVVCFIFYAYKKKYSKNNKDASLSTCK